VVVVNPREVVDFDLRFREINSSQPLRGYPQLALSDEVLQAVLAQQPIADIETTEDLRGLLTAESGEDLSIIRLQAIAQDPEDAAMLANIWATIFTAWANDIFSNRSGEQLSYFETQLVESQTNLALAEEALVEYQAINRTQIISNTLAAHLTAQANFLNRQQQINQLGQNVQHLRDQVVNGSGISPTLADQLTALSLQLAVFEATTTLPLLQVDVAGTLTSDNREEQMALLDNLLTTLTMQAEQVAVDLAELEPLIFTLQKELQEAESQLNQLQRNQLVAEETYLALARKVDEERITSQDTTTVQASEAAIPVNPTGYGTIVYLIIAIFMGSLMAVAGIFIYGWWVSDKNDQ
jgi:uncharacterized protein involved in exopolysaccharide biosynthesis